jgi:hypothetical protein
MKNPQEPLKNPQEPFPAVRGRVQEPEEPVPLIYKRTGFFGSCTL